jgi:hypothetical protein
LNLYSGRQLEAFNDHIRGAIEEIAEFRGSRESGKR